MSARRIVIVGSTGSGKSTLGRRVAAQLVITRIEMDALFWGPDWSQRSYDELRPIVDEATNETEWVVDGNYSRTQDTVWPKADTLVWLDYPLLLIMWRLW